MQRDEKPKSVSTDQNPRVRIKPSSTGEGILLGDTFRGQNGIGELVVHVDDLVGCSATDLQRTLRQMQSGSYGYNTVQVSEVPEGYFDEEESGVGPIIFELFNNALTMNITFLVDDWDDDDEQAEFVVKFLTPYLEHYQMGVTHVWQDERYAAPPWPWHARLNFSSRARLLTGVYSIGKQTIELLNASIEGGVDREAATHLLRAGYPGALIGQWEGAWLEVKKQHYDYSSPRGQISLCQAVSRFCNAEQGGLIVVGMSTKNLPDGDKIRAVTPVPIDAKTVRRCNQAVETRLFPPPDNLIIEAVTLGPGRGLILIDVPPQPEELKPFLVHGAIVDGEIEGSFISIVRRRGDRSVPVTAQMIHSTLAAGRGLLRRGVLPEDSV